MNAKIIESIPFPCIVTAGNNEILQSNAFVMEFTKRSSIQNINVKELFDVWEELEGGKLIHASCSGSSCIFIKTKLDATKRNLYIGTASTELISLINELKESKRVNRELDAIIENSYDGIYITDKDGVTLKTNSAIERITGIPKHYYIGKSVNALIDRGILENSVTHKVLEKKRSVSVVQLNRAGKKRC